MHLIPQASLIYNIDESFLTGPDRKYWTEKTRRELYRWDYCWVYDRHFAIVVVEIAQRDRPNRYGFRLLTNEELAGTGSLYDMFDTPEGALHAGRIDLFEWLAGCERACREDREAERLAA
jgi:hypothetical protein